MKWLGADPTSGGIENSATGILGNGHQTSPDMLRNPQGFVMEAQGRPQVRGSQDDSFVGYVFQRAQTDPDFPHYAANKQPARWALGDDTFIDQHQEQMVFMNTAMGTPPPHPSLVGQPHNRNGQIAQSTKKLWGMDEHQKDDKGGGTGGNILQHLGDHHQVWRDTTWSNAGELNHAVSQPISMAPRRAGSFPGPDPSSILSPRSETGGLGVKMVEYVLGSSPTSKELEPRLRVLGLNGSDVKKEQGDKAPSPFEGNAHAQKDNEVSGISQNGQASGVQNGMDDDKGFNRTPGSRQPSPSDEQLAGAVKQVKIEDQQLQPQTISNHPNHLPANVVVVPVPSNPNVVPQMAMHHAMHTMHPPPNMHHHHMQSMDGAQFDHHGMMSDQNQSVSVQQQQQLFSDPNNPNQGGYGMIAPPPPQQQSMDSPGVMQNFDVQAVFRNQPQTAPQQLQLLQQQQYIASQQQQPQIAGLAAPTFNGATYLINPQEQYATIIPGATVLPQYYGVPWPAMYPASLLQPNAAAAVAAQQQQQNPQQRRPLTPSSASDVSNSNTNLSQVPGGYQMIPAYYHENGGIVMGNMRGLGNATPLRLVSPAPVLVNPASAGNGVRLLNNQPQPIQTPPASLYSASQPPSLYSSTSGSGTPIGGSAAASLTGVGFNTLGLTQQQQQAQQTQQQQTNQQQQQSQQQPTLSAAVAASYGNNSLGTIGSPAVLGSLSSGLGLGSSSTGRRDSFDRNTSAFSPSLDYGRAKWGSTNYGALGTVTASQSPLGLTGGSLTPPPSLSLGSSALGAIMNSGRILSAAPGAEAAKFRSNLGQLHNGYSSVSNGLTSAGSTSPSSLSLSSQSLFAKLGQVAAGAAAVSNGLDAKAPGRSRLLEDFRNNRFPNLSLRDLSQHIVEFSQDQHGSRFIQQKLERASTADKQAVFNEILVHAHSLMTDVFGNYVIQKFFEFGTPEQKQTLAQKLKGNVLPLALQMYGCRVIQKALETISAEQQHEIVAELDGHVIKCVKDQNGNHVVQKCIECVDPLHLQFIISAFQSQVCNLSTHPYGCRVIQRILEHCTPEQTMPILDELHNNTEHLIQDQYGNYVIQHVLEHGNPDDKSKLINAVRGKVLTLSQHKFASNVVEKCVTHANRIERNFLIDEICSYADSNALQTMMKDQYANYVVQKMIDVAEPQQRKNLMHKIRPHLSSLRKYTYGKHIIAKLEKYFVKNTTPDLGPIGPPTVNPAAL
ncbi:pumilio homolog 2 isoform X3 [Cloeon dipterum]|uniref:pumilio homolog 2 isoform X3 n=1 Tax=Cloeon dipterum TaxID=197152 RepID=UPI0032204740